jgi:hypothetical protein
MGAYSLMARKKVSRLSGIKEKTVYRNSKGHFTTRDKSTAEEIWRYREAIVNGKKKKVDVKINYLPYRKGNIERFGSISIPEEGLHAGKLIYDARSKTKSPLETVLGKLGVDRHDTRIDISMTARTKSGAIVKRKLTLWHYNSNKLTAHTINGILHQLFYAHGDRPAYPVKVVKGSWRNRQTTKKETIGRRELYDVTFNIKTDVEKTRKQAKKKIPVKRKPIPKIKWGMDFTEE